jgi:hypothetical protein
VAAGADKGTGASPAKARTFAIDHPLSRVSRQETTMRVSTHWLLASLLAAAAGPASACYTVFDSANRILYQSDKPPVDMSRPLHETLPQRFPGGQLVFDLSAECQVISSVAMGDGGPVTGTSSPLLTNRDVALSSSAAARSPAGPSARRRPPPPAPTGSPQR